MSSSVVATAIDVGQEIANFPLIPYPMRVYVKEETVQNVGGIVIPEMYQKDGEMQTNVGFVVGVGEGVTFCKPGDKLIYGRYSGAWLMDKKYRVMNEEDILGRFKKDAGETGKGT